MASRAAERAAERPPPPPPPPRARFALDLAASGGAGATWLGLYLAHPLVARTSCPCTRADAPRFERFAVDFRWRPGETLANVAVGVALAAPVALFFFARETRLEWASDLLLVAESVAATGLLTQGAKTAASRPYPYMYGPAPFPEQNSDGVNYASFWSGHTAIAMAAAVSFAYLFHARRPHSPARWVAWLAGPAVALAAGLFELSAGNHFPSDVLAGAAVGAGMGLLIPWLHGLGDHGGDREVHEAEAL